MSLTDLRAAFADDCESYAPVFCECEYPAPTRLGECWTCRKLVVTDELRARVAAHKAHKEEA